jgi:deoxyribodipyrimidine photo-lyase
MNYQELIQRLDDIDPIDYGKSRNFTDGAITQLSPYISRGVIDTKTVLMHLVKRGFKYFHVQKFVQQMAWREFFQRVWQTEGERIHTDLKQEQVARFQHGMSFSVDDAATGIEAIDDSIASLKENGYMHNHIRMYVAFMTCNLAGFQWHDPARWMYYHLLDGDWASNALSWQWVAGTFSSKKYIANQENINHYTKSSQRKTFLDCSYEELAEATAPSHLLEAIELNLTTNLPAAAPLTIDSSKPTCVYNYYNLSPVWRKEEDVNRVLLLEPALFECYPVSDGCIAFMMEQCNNIEGIQVFVGSFAELQKHIKQSTLYFREHPLNKYYKGIEDPRAWMIQTSQPVKGSFFSFWKKYERQIEKEYF